jgi:hypothetical protein
MLPNCTGVFTCDVNIQKHGMTWAHTMPPIENGMAVTKQGINPPPSRCLLTDSLRDHLNNSKQEAMKHEYIPQTLTTQNNVKVARLLYNLDPHIATARVASTMSSVLHWTAAKQAHHKQNCT